MEFIGIISLLVKVCGGIAVSTFGFSVWEATYEKEKWTLADSPVGRSCFVASCFATVAMFYLCKWFYLPVPF